MNAPGGAQFDHVGVLGRGPVRVHRVRPLAVQELYVTLVHGPAAGALPEELAQARVGIGAGYQVGGIAGQELGQVVPEMIVGHTQDGDSERGSHGNLLVGLWRRV